MEGRYNTRSPAVKRLMREAQELREPTDQYFAQPLEDNLFEWHFTVRGPADSDFQNGIYHGRIILPVDYPMKPPSIIWLTPNGRFETNKKICLSISGHHPESWQPSWSIRTALLAIIGFMPTHPGGAIGSLDYTPEERKTLAKRSREWKCPACGDVTTILLEMSPESSHTAQEAKELATQINFQGEKPKCKEGECPVEAVAVSAATTNSSSGAMSAASASQEPVSDVSDSTLPASSSNNAETTAYPDLYKPFPTWPLPVSVMPGALNPSYMFQQFPWNLPAMPSAGQEYRVPLVPQFPYPPSHYPGGYSVPFYPPGLALPPGVGVFPVPFPPPPSARHRGANEDQFRETPLTSPAISVNNSSANTPADNTNTQVPYTPSPMVAPILSRPAEAQASTDHSPPPVLDGSVPEVPFTMQAKKDVMSELLTKVKRVGSEKIADAMPVSESLTYVEETVLTAATEKSADAMDSEYKSQVQGAAAAMSDLPGLENDGEMEDGAVGYPLVQVRSLEGLSPEVADGTCVDDPQEVGDSVSMKLDSVDSLLGHGPKLTDSEVSVSLVKKESLNRLTGTEMTHPDLPVDVDDSSEAGIAPIEVSDVEQRSNLEKSTSNSMPELKKKLKQGNAAKGLRQRQSATSRMSAGSSEEVQATPEQTSTHSGRSRIEAASGDNSIPRNIQRLHRQATRAIHDARQNHQELLRARGRQSPYDTSFLVMIGLSVLTLIIVLKRLVHLFDWEYLTRNSFQ